MRISDWSSDVCSSDLGIEVVVLDLARSIEAFPPPEGVEAIACDASDEAQVAAAFDAIAAGGARLDALVNFVGFTNEPKPIEAMALAEWNEIIAGSLTSAFLLSPAAIPLLRAFGKGAKIHVSSTFGVWGPQSGSDRDRVGQGKRVSVRFDFGGAS